MNLFEEFNPVSRKEWDEKVRADLKGADLERLNWKTGEGFTMAPYYTSEDMDDLAHLAAHPGQFPFVRGKKESGNNWFVRQDIYVDDIRQANEKALEVLMKGVDSLGFILNEEREYSKEDLDALLRNIFAEIVEINFVYGGKVVQLMENHYEMIQRYNRDFARIHGSIGFDPFSRLILRGNYYESLEDDLGSCRKLIGLARHLPHFTVITVRGDHFHDAGATAVEELAYSLSQGAEYLTRLTEAGLSINEVAPNIKFTFGIGTNYFMEIAKIRAARLLWAHIVKAYGPSSEEPEKMNIHAVTSGWNMTVYDPFVNMLRTTTEAMSSIIAGVDSLTVQPYNRAFEPPGPFSERIARNQQLLLKEESYLDKVADPAAGSYYIEKLTASVAEEAWKLFLETDSQGGYLEAVSNGMIQRRITATVAQRDLAVATRKEILLGTNQYPSFDERKQEDIPDAVFSGQEKEDGEKLVETIKRYRGAMAFERLRYATNVYSGKYKRPAAFMFTFGNLAMRIARSQFSRNFFACAGYEVIDNLGFSTIEEGVRAFRESEAEILVVCSSDDEYPVIVPEIIAELNDGSLVAVAGFPKYEVERLRATGVFEFIHLRSNVLEILQRFQQKLGIQ